MKKPPIHHQKENKKPPTKPKIKRKIPTSPLRLKIWTEYEFQALMQAPDPSSIRSLYSCDFDLPLLGNIPPRGEKGLESEFPAGHPKENLDIVFQMFSPSHTPATWMASILQVVDLHQLMEAVDVGSEIGCKDGAVLVNAPC